MEKLLLDEGSSLLEFLFFNILIYMGLWVGSGPSLCLTFLDPARPDTCSLGPKPIGSKKMDPYLINESGPGGSGSGPGSIAIST